jgi:phage terminase large subunit-like protein
MKKLNVGPQDMRLALALTEMELEHDRASLAQRSWLTIARPEQLPPEGKWRTWLILAGRRWGKTRTGAETIVAWSQAGQVHQVIAVGQTAADSRDVLADALRTVIVGHRDDGSPMYAMRPDTLYEPSKLRIILPGGATVRLFSAEDPDALRGYGADCAWCDELAAWRYPESYDQVQIVMSLGRARQIVTTTPRPVRVIRELAADPETIITRGRTIDNEENLRRAAMATLLRKYGGTRLGRQEIDGELLEDVPGALWTRDRIDELRITAAPELSRIVVGIDPAVSSSEDADETGIVVAAKGADGQGYLLADLSCRASPDGWARRAVEALRSWGADRIVAEVNQGGDLVESMIRTIDPGAPYRGVHASRGKRTRAEPVSALYEQGRIHHVGAFPALEDQLCAALPDGGSGPDDRLDALVWAFTELGLTGSSLDLPGVIAWMYSVWWCRCGHGYPWAPGRPCPRCRTPAPETYDEPVPPPTE